MPKTTVAVSVAYHESKEIGEVVFEVAVQCSLSIQAKMTPLWHKIKKRATWSE